MKARIGQCRKDTAGLFFASVLALFSHWTAAETLPDIQKGWGEDGLSVHLSIAVQSTLPDAFLLETLTPTVTYLRRRFPDARIGFERVSPEELQTRIRTQNVFAFVADSGFFADVQARGWAEQIAAHVPASVLEPAYAAGTAVVVRADDPADRIEELAGRRFVSDSPDNFNSWVIFEGFLHERGINAPAFLKNVAYTNFVAPMPIERLAKGEADAAVVPACELEREEAEGRIKPGEFRVLHTPAFLNSRCRRTGNAYPGVIFAVPSQVTGAMAKALTVALLEMPKSELTGEWSIVTDFERVKTLYRDLGRGPYAYLRANTPAALWARYQNWFYAAMSVFVLLIIYLINVRLLVRRRTRDLTRALSEKEASEAEAKKTREALSLMERAGIVSELSSVFAHEVRQPVAASVAYAGALRLYASQTYPTDPLIPETAQKLETEAQKVSAIVERVRGYARGKVHPRRAMLLGDVVGEAEKYFRQSAVSAGVTLKTTADRPVMIEAEPLEMTLAVLNLLKNAAQAMKAADVKTRLILVDARETAEGFAELTVTDTGPGADAETLERMNARGPQQSTKADGLGLGLMLVARVVESHGGSVRFSSEQGAGLTVTIRLPSAKEQTKEEKTNE